VEGHAASHGSGVYGASGDSSRYGVHGSNTNEGIGVYGTTNSTSADTTVAGVYGDNSSTGLAGYFNGPVKVNGVLTVNSCTGCSDARLKHDIKPIMGAMDQLLQLEGVTFEWIDPKGTHHEQETGTVTGFIAQDVEKIHPDWVNPEGYTAPDGTKYRTLDTRQIEALEVEAIRQLKTKNDELEARLHYLETGAHPIAATMLPQNLNFNGAGWAAAGALGMYIFANRKKKAQA